MNLKMQNPSSPAHADASANTAATQARILPSTITCGVRVLLGVRRRAGARRSNRRKFYFHSALFTAEPRPELAMELESAGIKSASLPLYATHPTRTRGDRVDLFRQRVDAALFASPSAVTGCFASAEVPLGLPAGCIGPTTAAAARSAGLSNVYTSKTRDLDGLLTALHDPLASNPQTS